MAGEEASSSDTTTDGAVSANPVSPFFKLPHDVRIQIYDYAIRGPQPSRKAYILLGQWPMKKPVQEQQLVASASLSRVCQQIHRESRATFYRGFVFYFWDATGLDDWIKDIGPANAALVDHIEICLLTHNVGIQRLWAASLSRSNLCLRRIGIQGGRPGWNEPVAIICCLLTAASRLLNFSNDQDPPHITLRDCSVSRPIDFLFPGVYLFEYTDRMHYARITAASCRPSFPFLRLPPELRRRIYVLCLQAPGGIVMVDPRRRGTQEWQKVPAPQLCRLSRFVHAEASTVLYGSNTFDFGTTTVENLTWFSTVAGRANNSLVRAISFRIGQADSHLTLAKSLKDSGMKTLRHIRIEWARCETQGSPYLDPCLRKAVTAMFDPAKNVKKVLELNDFEESERWRIGPGDELGGWTVEMLRIWQWKPREIYDGGRQAHPFEGVKGEMRYKLRGYKPKWYLFSGANGGNGGAVVGLGRDNNFLR
jgi:hypothetical protein